MAYDEPELESLVPAGTEKTNEPGGASWAALEEVASLRPRTAAEILDVAVDVLRLRFFACVGIAILVWIPGRLLHFMYLEHLVDQADPAMVFVFIGLEWIMMGFQGLVAVALVAVVTNATLSGQWVSGWSALSSSLRNIVILFFAALMSGFLNTLAKAACLVPFLFVGYRLLFTQIVAVIEPVGPFEAMKRSWDLTRGGFMVYLRWVVICLAGWTAMFTISQLAGVFDFPDAMEFFSDKLGSPPAIVTRSIAFIISTLFMAFATAIWSCVVTAYYVDCRMRREGTDLLAWLGRVETAHPVADLSVRRGLA